MTKLGKWGMGSTIVLASTLAVAVAQAQEAPATSSAPASDAAGTDVVRLKNGGLLRGKISELIPGDSVTIITLSGKTREFPMSEVDYAGPAAKDPQATSEAAAPAAKAATPVADDEEEEEDSKPKARSAAKPYVTVNGRESRLHIVAPEAGITFHRQSATAVSGAIYATGYERLCTAPCQVTLPAGTETIALSRDGDPPIAADPVTLPAGDAQLHGRLESRGGIRAAGWLTLIGGAVAGGVVMFTSSSKGQECSFGTCSETTEINMGQLIAGAALMGVGLGVGLVLVRVPDSAVVQVESASASNRPLTLARGVTLSGHF
jgi:hypothetical protein